MHHFSVSDHLRVAPLQWVYFKDGVQCYVAAATSCGDDMAKINRIVVHGTVRTPAALATP